MKVYVVMEIGCVECGDASHLLGVFTTREQAEACHEDDPPYWMIFEAELDKVLLTADMVG